MGLNCSFVYGSRWYDFVDQEMINCPTLSERSDVAVLMGCDYLDRAYGNSIVKIKSIFNRWRDDREGILAEIELKGQVGGKRMRSGLPGFTEQFHRASSIFQFAPCFVVRPTDINVTARDAFWSDNYEVYRGNIRTISADVNEFSLFGFLPDDHLPVDIQLKDMFKSVVWIRTSTPFLQHLILPPRNSEGQVLPWGCDLDFNIVSVHMQPTRALICYLESRGLSPRSTNTRQQIDSAVLRVVSQGVRGPAIIPSTVNQDSGHYINLEVLTCGEPIVWITSSEEVFCAVRGLRTKFDDSFVDNYFGMGRNGVRERAWGRVIAGHFDLTTLRSSDCKCRSPSGIVDVSIFSIQCTPSMKKDAYMVHLILTKANDIFMPGPASRCNCPVGRLFCSHLLAFIVLLGMIQMLNDDEDYKWFLANMPEPVKSLHSMCIPFAYVF